MEIIPTWLSPLADILGILGFFISIIVANKVYNNNTNSINAQDAEIGRDFVGRDKNA